MRSQSPFALTPWIKGLIAANIVIYFLTITVFTGPWFLDFFGFQPRRVVSHWWTPVTYMFLHGGFLHLAFNMLMLFFFGPAVEAKMGGRRFALYYLVCGLGGAILSLGLMLTTPVAGVVGASGAVFGVALAFAMYWPDEGIYVFPLPMPVKAKWLVIFLATVSLVAAITGARDGVAHLAHLGGFAFGFLFLKAQGLVERRVQEARQRPRLAHVVPSRPPRQRQAAERSSPSEPSEPSLDDELNRVLDKISHSGVDSLTPGERRLLDEASRQLRDN
ncbi:MAG: rhomboid family intramembrane serine protease [Gemmatimonadota bacterium]|nr:rhomboid family intramembrane serine protease [Gemmatimonadota bacterium]